MAETTDEQELILREGVGLRLQLGQEEMRQKALEEGRETAPNEAAVSLVAALQCHQEQEAEYLMRDLATKVGVKAQSICILGWHTTLHHSSSHNVFLVQMRPRIFIS